MAENELFSARFYRYHQPRLILYYTLSILTLGFLPFMLRKSPKYLFYLCRRVTEIEEAEFVGLVAEDYPSIPCELVRKEVRFSPLRPLKQTTFFWNSKQLFYYSQKRKAFKKIENKFLKSLEKNPGQLNELTRGLDEKVVAELASFYGDNVIDFEVKTRLEYFAEELFSPFMIGIMITEIVFLLNGYVYCEIVILCWMLYDCKLMAGERYEAAVKMRELSLFEGPVRVVRRINQGLSEVVISSRQLVLGDLVLMEGDSVISTDFVLVSGNCLVSEANLTGESTPVSKAGVLGLGGGVPQLAEKNKVIGGSVCIVKQSKSLRGIVCKIGCNSSRGNMLTKILNAKVSEFKFKKDITIVLMVLLVVGLFISIIILYFEIKNEHFRFQIFLFKMFEILLNSVPPTLFIAFTQGLSSAGSRLREKQINPVLIEKINEAGRVKHVCFDKTGTLTENTVRLEAVVGSEEMQSGGEGESISKGIDLGDSRVVELMACCNGLSLINGRITGDPIDEELFLATDFTFEEKYLENSDGIEKKIYPSVAFRQRHGLGPEVFYTQVKINEFDASRRRVSVAVKASNAPGLSVFVKGTPETLRKLCKNETVPENFEEFLALQSEKGLRVLAMAYRKIDELGPETPDLGADSLEKDLEFLGLFLLANPIKPGTASIISELRAASLYVCMITGDNIFTSISVAYATGILNSTEPIFVVRRSSDKQGWIFRLFEAVELRRGTGENFSATARSRPQTGDLRAALKGCRAKGARLAVDGEFFDELFAPRGEGLDAQSRADFFRFTAIYARTRPETKAEIVRQLRSAGPESRCVAFVGDGSNDSLAIQAANVGLSIGSNESSIAAAFSTPRSDIRPALDVLIEGRATLEISLQNFKLNIVSSFIELSGCFLLYFFYLDYNNFQLLYSDVLVSVPLALAICSSPPIGKLNLNLPRVSILNREILGSIISNILISFLFLLITYYTMYTDLRYKDTFDIIPATHRIKMDDYYFYQSHYVVFIMTMLVVGIALGFNRGYPFRKGPSSTPLFFVIAIALITFSLSQFFLIDFAPSWLNYFLLQVNRIPNYERSLTLKVIGIGALALMVGFLNERIISSYFLVRKRELNAMLRERKRGKKERVAIKELLKDVSVN